MTTEIWKDVEGYKGTYQVSSQGKIRQTRSGKLLKTAPGGRGYPIIQLWGNGKSKTVYLHRLIALTFLGQPSNATLTEVHHKNTNRKDARLENLEWTTPHSNCDAKCLKYGMGKYNQRDNPIEYMI